MNVTSTITDSRGDFLRRLESLAPEHQIDSASLATLLRLDHIVDGAATQPVGPRPVMQQGTDLHSQSDSRSTRPARSQAAPSAGQGSPAQHTPSRKVPTVLVPGLLGDSVRKLVAPMMCARRHLAIEGYDVSVAWVNGRAGCDRNAKRLRHRILDIAERVGEPVHLIGYSKGCTDSLHMLARHPETHSAVRSLVSLCGVVSGTPLAANPSMGLRRLLQFIPLPGEGFGDGRAIVDLAPDFRRQWLQDNPLPASVRYASIIAAPTPQQVSRILRGSWTKLKSHSLHNDSQVIDVDSLLPNSELLAIINADHWAAALPFSASTRFLGPALERLLITRNDYPRDWLLQACIDHLSEPMLALPSSPSG